MTELDLPVRRPRYELEREVVPDLDRSLDGRARNADPDTTKHTPLARWLGAKERELAQRRVASDEDELVGLLDDSEGQLGKDARCDCVRVAHVQGDVVELRRVEAHPVRLPARATGKPGAIRRREGRTPRATPRR